MLIKKLVTYEDMGLVQWGVLDETETGVYGAIALEGNEGLLALADALEQNEKTHAVAAQPLDTVRIMAPIPHVERNIFCIGKNYADHIAEFDKTTVPELPKYPMIFTKATTSVIGPDDLIDPHKNVTSALDYEGELAVIIGKEGSDIPVGEAMDYVYGFTILNDVTARDLQANHSQWFHGKSSTARAWIRSALWGPSCSCGTLRPIPLRSSPRSTAKYVRTRRQANSSSPFPSSSRPSHRERRSCPATSSPRARRPA